MPISAQTDKSLHRNLPIDADEKILAVFKHHWFAYASSWVIGVVMVLVVMGVAVAFTATAQPDSLTDQYRVIILAGASLLSAVILVGTGLPVYLRSQELLVLTEEALLQVLQPSLFNGKVSQLSLQHIADVSVKQDFFGTMLGFGHISVETPGEQNNYQFSMLPDPHSAARQIINAHENFDAALQGGRLPTKLSTAMPEAPQIDPQQYQQFLQYQKMVAEQQREQANQSNDPTNNSQSQQ
jgi:hypothetical protein